MSEIKGESDADEEARQIALEALYGVCTLITLPSYGERLEGTEDAPLAYTMDGSQYRADLITQTAFGCVLGEAVEP